MLSMLRAGSGVGHTVELGFYIVLMRDITSLKLYHVVFVMKSCHTRKIGQRLHIIDLYVF